MIGFRPPRLSNAKRLIFYFRSEAIRCFVSVSLPFKVKCKSLVSAQGIIRITCPVALKMLLFVT